MSRVPPSVRFDLPDDDTLTRWVDEPLPLALEAGPGTRSFHRDVYFDTDDRALEKRGVTCRMRISSDDRRSLSLRITDVRKDGRVVRDDVYAADVVRADIEGALAGTSEPARRLQGFIDPGRLRPVLELETERFTRQAKRGRWRPAHFEVTLDRVTVRGRRDADTFRELKVRAVGNPGRSPTLEHVADALQERHALRAMLLTKVQRAERRRGELESDELARAVRGSREVAIIAMASGRVAVLHDGRGITLPVLQGAGEDACRQLLRMCFGTMEGRVRLIGTAPAADTRVALEVWVVEDLPRDVEREAPDGMQWVGLSDIVGRVGSPVLREPRTLAALAVAARNDLLPSRRTGAPPTEPESRPESLAAELDRPALPPKALDPSLPVPDHFVNEHLSWLAFNARVLALAEDPGTPLLARMMFLSIFSSNLDEFFMVQVGTLKQAIATGVTKRSVDGLTVQEELDAIMIRLAALVDRQQQCLCACLPELGRRGIRVRRWETLDEDEREAMRQFFDHQIFPVLTPQAMTQAPGHPFPHLANLTLSLAIVVRDQQGGPVHFAHVRLPSGLPRFVPIPGEAGLVPLEDVVANNLQSLYPGRRVQEAHPFRITRAADIQVDEESAANLLQAVEEEVRRRPFGAVVRIEVAAAMPQVMRDLLRRELSFEDPGQPATLTAADIVEADDLVDLTALKELGGAPHPSLHFPPFEGVNRLDPQRSIFELIRERDRLVHHPYDAFSATVQRFLHEAADDPDVIAIKLTMYRSGSQSAIVDALTRAAAAGKDVSVFVELKARFDEERNIHWARKLEAAGIHVVTGLVRLKTHAKVALVVRREGEEVRRYVHIGTGNYNASTAKQYTDLGVMTCHEEVGADLHLLFNEFTGSSAPPRKLFKRLLVAPNHMLDRFLALIDREIEHAQARGAGRIRVKLNGLADTEMISALYRASQAGVQIDCIVRGICALRPGVPGLSERIRVYSILGRFLEHARIYHFGNNGADEYYIGSADWRPRNLRRRVEVVTPVFDPDARRRLDEILELELEDPTAWQMRPDGSYERRPLPVGVDCISAQERFMQRAAPSSTA